MGARVGLDVFVKVTVKSVFTEWSYRVSRGMAPLILNLGARWREVSCPRRDANLARGIVTVGMS
jgi:hypothetical protein